MILQEKEIIRAEEPNHSLSSAWGSSVSLRSCCVLCLQQQQWWEPAGGGSWARAGMAGCPWVEAAVGSSHPGGLGALRVQGRYWRAVWLQSWASTDYSAAPESSQEPQYVCFTILLLLKDCDRQLYVWHGWHIQHKAWLDLIYIHIKCQKTDCEMFALNRDEGCVCVCLVCVIVFSFSLVLHKNLSYNFLTEVPFLISGLSNV